MSSLIKKHYGTVSRGKIQFDVPEDFKANVCLLEGKKVYVVIDKISQKRSTNQNSYYWKVVVKLISDYTGHTPEEVHEAMKLMFLKVPAENGFPETMRSSTSLTTAEFVQFTENVKRWAAQTLGIYCPDPGDCDW